MRSLPKPFVKWVGGKGQLLEQISRILPAVHFDRYFEPFVGGGAVFFHLYRQGYRDQAFLSDLNEELIVAYQTIRSSVEAVITELQSGKYQPNKQTYYQIRKWDRQQDWSEVDPVRRTARMIYLNKTCFNGLYRVNKSGKFNASYGFRDNPTICDSDNLMAVSLALRNVRLRCIDFSEAVKVAGPRDFIYFDPPCERASTKEERTGYVPGDFSEEDHRRVAAVSRGLDERGCLVLHSSPDDPMIRLLYATTRYIVESVQARRAVSQKAESRGPIPELLIRNYRETRQKRIA